MVKVYLNKLGKSFSVSATVAGDNSRRGTGRLTSQQKANFEAAALAAEIAEKNKLQIEKARIDLEWAQMQQKRAEANNIKTRLLWKLRQSHGSGIAETIDSFLHKKPLLVAAPLAKLRRLAGIAAKTSSLASKALKHVKGRRRGKPRSAAGQRWSDLLATTQPFIGATAFRTPFSDFWQQKAAAATAAAVRADAEDRYATPGPGSSSQNLQDDDQSTYVSGGSNKRKWNLER